MAVRLDKEPVHEGDAVNTATGGRAGWATFTTDRDDLVLASVTLP